VAFARQRRLIEKSFKVGSWVQSQFVSDTVRELGLMRVWTQEKGSRALEEKEVKPELENLDMAAGWLSKGPFD
jgi:hypothetical protein